MLVDNTYFQGKRFIPNINEPEVNNRTGYDLHSFIDSVEKNVLSYCFGLEMWKDFKEKYNDQSTFPDNYKNLVEGTSYEFEEKTYYWSGILEVELKRSFLADLVYYNFKIHQNSQASEFGEVSADTKVGNKASITPKVIEAYNSFIIKCFGGFRGFADGLTLEGNPVWVVSNRLGNGIGLDYYGINRQSKDVSMMQFLFDNKADYPLLDLDYRRYGGERKNQFGI